MKAKLNSSDGSALLSNPKAWPPYDNSSASQRARIMRHFASNPCLTTLQARNDLGILHPGGRVLELRKEGYQIDTYWSNEPDSNGVLHRVAKYVYKGRKQRAGMRTIGEILFPGIPYVGNDKAQKEVSHGSNQDN